MTAKKVVKDEVQIQFDPELLGCSIDAPCIYGVPVTKSKDGTKLIGTVTKEIADAFIEAGKAK